MAYVPINLDVPQYSIASPNASVPGGYGVLRVYIADTDTVSFFYTDATGSVALNQVELNSGGFPIFNGETFLPHIDDSTDYKLALYNTKADADSDDLTKAAWWQDNITPISKQTINVTQVTGISTFGASLIDDETAAEARTTLGVDAAGTDNSTDVTLAGTPDYITISGQVITRGQIDLTTDVTGQLPIANGGTGSTAGAGFTLITSTSTSAVTTIDFTDATTGLFDGTYNAICIKFWGVVPATDNASLKLRIESTTEWEAGASDYDYQYLTAYNTTISGAKATADHIPITVSGVGSDANEDGVSGEVWIFMPEETTRYVQVMADCMYVDPASELQYVKSIGHLNVDSSCEGVRFFWSSGDFEAGGKFVVYGVD